MTATQSDSLLKGFLRDSYTAVCGLRVALNVLLPRPRRLAVGYGGARKGDVGGPLVKVKRLQAYFPEVAWRYSVVYLLSNAPYLPAYALNLLKRRRIPIVYNQNGVFYPGWFDGDWRQKNRQMAKAYHAADWVFYQSEFCRACAEQFLGTRRGQGEILFNAVDTDLFSPASDQAEAIDGSFRFLVTGKIGNHLFYRLENSIQALALARKRGLDAELEIAGWVEADAQSRATSLADHLGVGRSVSLTGQYTQAQAPEIYRRADAYLMTKHNDPCPNTVLEALASGLPVVYSTSGGVPELVGNDAGIGVFCAAGWDRPSVPDPEAVAAAMMDVARAHRSYAAAARKRALEKFSIGPWIERHREVFERLRSEAIN